MRRSWPIDFRANKYLVIRRSDLKSGETPVAPNQAVKILERYCQNPNNLSQLVSLALAVEPGLRADTVNIKRMMKAFASGDFVLLLRATQTARVETAAEENVADQIQKAQIVKTWVEFQVVDAVGNPCPNLQFVCVLPDGAMQQGTLSAKGTVRFDGIDPGNCSFSLLNQDQDAWEPVA